MPAFMVFTRERMRDEKEYEIYKQKNRVAMQGHPIKKHALYGKHKVLEGAEVQGVVYSRISNGCGCGGLL